MTLKKSLTAADFTVRPLREIPVVVNSTGMAEPDYRETIVRQIFMYCLKILEDADS
ncbi:MAG: hypothetical protein PHE95_03640 [Candidatus Methanomethylophilus sp.]|nr:hypothetical protein [Methanomethylophilus sp.]